MRADKIPNAFFALGLFLEAIFKTSIGFIGRNDKIFSYCNCRGVCLNTTLLFIKSIDRRNNKSSLANYCLKCIPH